MTGSNAWPVVMFKKFSNGKLKPMTMMVGDCFFYCQVFSILGVSSRKFNRGDCHMKKIVLGMLLVMMVAVSAEAREMKPGTVKFSGATNASIMNTTTDINGEEADDTDSIELETSAVYFLNKNIGVGAGIAYENSDSDGFESTTIVIGPTLAVDVPINQSLNFIADATVAYFQNKMEFGNGELDIDGFAWGASAGLAMFPAESVSLDITANYLALDGEESDSGTDFESSSFGLNLGVSVYFD